MADNDVKSDSDKAELPEKKDLDPCWWRLIQSKVGAKKAAAITWQPFTVAQHDADFEIPEMDENIRYTFRVEWLKGPSWGRDYFVSEVATPDGRRCQGFEGKFENDEFTIEAPCTCDVSARDGLVAKQAECAAKEHRDGLIRDGYSVDSPEVIEAVAMVHAKKEIYDKLLDIHQKTIAFRPEIIDAFERGEQWAVDFVAKFNALND
jgi:hypothetical protein